MVRLRGGSFELIAVVKETPDTITFSVYDKDENIKITDEVMTLTSVLTYKGIIQTLASWAIGKYYVIVKTVLNGKEDYEQEEFSLKKPKDGSA